MSSRCGPRNCGHSASASFSSPGRGSASGKVSLQAVNRKTAIKHKHQRNMAEFSLLAGGEGRPAGRTTKAMIESSGARPWRPVRAAMPQGSAITRDLKLLATAGHVGRTRWADAMRVDDEALTCCR